MLNFPSFLYIFVSKQKKRVPSACMLFSLIHSSLLMNACTLTVLRRDDVDVRNKAIAWILSVLSCIFWDRSEYMAFENATGLLP